MIRRILRSLLLVTFVVALAMQVFAGYEIETIARSGYNVLQVKSLVQNRLQRDPPLDYAFLLVGTNDSINSFNRVNITLYEQTYRNTLQLLIDNDVTPFAVELPPALDVYVMERHPGLTILPNESLANYTEALRRAAAATSPTTQVVELRAEFLEHTDYSINSWMRNAANSGSRDGVHPTVQGNLEIATIYSRYLEAPVYERKNVALFGDSITYSVHYPAPFRPGDFLMEIVNITAAGEWRRYR